MDKSYFVSQVAEAIKENICELFVGSGISCSAKLPNWKDLLRPVAQAYGFDVDITEDLPLVAQYILNENSGNRNVLTKLVSDHFDVHGITTQLHHIIANMGITQYWTTNYDPLLEEALSKNANVSVICKDADLKKSIRDDNIVVIKLHGSYNEPDSIILTRNDYDNYFMSHSLIQEQLSATLTRKSILFIGYSYSDPDIRMIMAHAQSKLNGTQNHYLITKRPQKGKSKQSAQQERMFDGWIKELQRLGIHVLCIDNYDELPSILREISMQSRGRSVFITGSHKTADSIIHKEAIVRKILDVDGILINGQSAGVGLYFLNSFCEIAFDNKKDISRHLRLFNNPYSINSRFSDDKSLIPELKRLRYELFQHTQMMIFYPGGMGTIAEQDMAIEQGCCILPIIENEDSYINEAVQYFMNQKEAEESLYMYAPGYMEILRRRGIPSENDVLDAIERILKGQYND